MFALCFLVFSFGESISKTLCCLLLVIGDCNDISTGSGMIVLLFHFCMVLDPLWYVNQMGQGCNML